MRWITLFAALMLSACGDDDTTGPRPSERFVGTWTLESMNGDALPVVLITPSDTFERISTILEVNADGYLPEAVATDSLLEIDAGGNVVGNASVHETYTGFVKGDTVSFEIPGTSGPVYRFVVEDSAVPVRIGPDGTPLAETWSRR